MGADHEAAASGATKEDIELELLLKNEKEEDDESLVILPFSGFGYNAGNRPYRDIGFSIAFAVFVTASFVVGIFGAFNSNSDYRWIESESFTDPDSCTLPKASSKSLGSEHASRDAVNFINWEDPSVKATVSSIVATVILGAPLCYGLFWLLRTYTKEIVYVTLPLFVVLPMTWSSTMFVYCSNSVICQKSFDPTTLNVMFAFVPFMNILFLLVLCRNWGRVELTIRVIRTASEALHKNLRLLLVLPALNVCYSGLYLIPAGAFLFFAYGNGKMVTNPKLLNNPQRRCGGNLPCCVWETDGWVPAYLILTGFVILWGASIVAQIHVFVISGTVSQWYFATTQSSTAGSTKRSLKHAFGPSFGTLCLAGLVVSCIRLIKGAIERSRSSRGAIGLVALLVRACLACLLSAVEFLTKFTTNFAAITGKGFCGSAFMTYELLKRNFLSTMVVEAITGRLLGPAVFVLAAVYGLLVWGVLALFSDGKDLWLMALLAFFLLLIFSGYCAGVLQCVVDAVYICYAMDKDHNEVSQPEVHDVYVLLPAADDGTASLAVARP